MLESMSLTELEQEMTRVNNEIKRVFCSRSEHRTRDRKIHELSQIRQELEQGIREIRSLTLSEAKKVKAGTGI